MSRLACLIVTALMFIAVGCGDDANVAGPDPIDYDNISNIDYSEHVQPLLNAYAEILMTNNILPDGLNMDSWENLIKGWERGEVIIPFDADNSLLVELTTKLDNPVELEDAQLRFLQRWIDEGAQNDAGEVPFENSTHRLYACSQNAALVSIIDTEANVVMRTVKLDALGFTAGSKPHHTAVEPDGSAWYLSLIGDSKILKFSRDNSLLAESIDIVLPALLAIHPSANILYVSRFMDPANPQSAVFALNRQTLEGAAEIDNADGEIPVLLNTPHGLVIDHTGSYVYFASLSQHQIIVVNASTNEVEAFVPLGENKGPLQMAVSPDDSELYISNRNSGEMFVLDISDPAVATIVDSIEVGLQPWHPTFTPDGSRLYVPNFESNSVSVINTASRTVIATITGDGLSQPHGIAIKNDGSSVYVSSRNLIGAYTPKIDLGDNANIGTVVVINTSTNQIEKIIEIEEFGSGMSIWEM